VRHLDLFSGIGGFALAARRVGWQTVGFCEIDPFCQKVLRKHFDAPIYDDIRSLDGKSVGPVDVISGGAPCQPYSQAGKQRGSLDHRELWPEFVRVVGEARPRWAVGENVVGFIRLGLDKLCDDLEAQGYACESFVVPASVFRPHKRERVWIVAHSIGHEQPRKESRSWATRRVGREQQSVSWDAPWESALALFRGLDYGLPGRVVRSRTDSIRNSIVPQIAEVIFRAIDEADAYDGGAL